MGVSPTLKARLRSGRCRKGFCLPRPYVTLQFRVAAKSMVDWICDYYQGVEELPVRSELHIGDVSSLLPPEAPTGPESWTKISQDFQEKIMPGECPHKILHGIQT